MLNPSQHLPFSDGTIRRFLLAQLSREEQEGFEAALLAAPQLDQRARLAEIALVDDYVLGRLRAKDRDAFQKKFLVTTARRRQLEVSEALRQTVAAEVGSQHARSSKAQRLFAWPAFAWRVAFAIVTLMVLFASALVIRREPQIVKQIVPRRLRPAAVTTPTPQPAHHAPGSSETPVHRDESQPLPAHEAARQMIVMRPGVTADNAPVLTRAPDNSNVVRLELMLDKPETATFSIVVTAGGGEVVHNVPEIHVEDAERIDFDVQVDRLKAGEFQVTVTQLGGDSGVVRTYHFRVQ